MAKLKNTNQILDAIQKTQMRDDLPSFGSGDTISVHVKITEGSKTRVQRFEGVVLRVRGSGLGKTFIIRKDSYGIGVEETFSYHSPLIVKILVLKHGKVRRAYISYMRGLSGKSARIKTRIVKK